MLSIEEYFKELLEKHPYKQKGNSDSYNTYNEGWQDALDLAMQLVKKIQIDAIEETCKLCAENAECDENAISRQSILQCAEMLKKEINEQ